MNKRGFTLVELLAVIVILSLLALLTSTAVTKLVKEAKNELSVTQIELIKSSAETWGAENLNRLPSAGECSYLTIEDLKNYGLLDNKILDPKNNEDIPNDLKIKITTTLSKYGNPTTNYEVNPESIEGCVWLYEPVCTYTDVDNSNTLNLSDIVTCKLTESTDKFYVISNVSDDSQTIQLLPEKNIDVREFRQSDDAGTTDFATQNGVDENGNNIYNDLLTPIINGYVSYLNQSNLGATGEIINSSQLERLGCFASNYQMGYYCQGTSGIAGEVVGTAPSWVYTPTYWGELFYENARWYVASFIDYSYIGSTSYGVRPVITLPVMNIK